MLAIAAACACVALGMAAARRLRLREATLAAWMETLFRLEGAAARGETPADMLGAAGGQPSLREMRRRLLEEPAGALTENLPWDEGLLPEERAVLKRCLDALLSPRREAQLHALEAGREQWARFCAHSREEKEKNAPLVLRLGWLAGAALFIFMC